MRLIEATEKAVAKYPKQYFGTFSDAEGACWIGALHGVGAMSVVETLCTCEPSRGRYHHVYRTCPECKAEVHGCYMALGIHLNDTHEWSREAISLYLSQFEPPEVEKEAEIEAVTQGA